jgi:hypothetical protein
MNLYLIKRLDNWTYDDYDSAVVAAKSVEAARKMNPAAISVRYDPKKDTDENTWTSWILPKDRTEEMIEVRLVGKADKSITEPCVLCASFNAG